MRITILVFLLFVFACNVFATDVLPKQTGLEISFENTLVSMWQIEDEDGVELRVRFPRNWTLVNFAREWPSWQTDMKGFHATFKTPDGFVTVFYGGKAFRSQWKNFFGETPSFDEGMTTIRKIKWIPM